MQCCIAIAATQDYLHATTILKVTMVSKQLKLSAALSFVLMTGFAIDSQLATIAPQPLIGG